LTALQLSNQCLCYFGIAIPQLVDTVVHCTGKWVNWAGTFPFWPSILVNFSIISFCVIHLASCGYFSLVLVSGGGAWWWKICFGDDGSTDDGPCLGSPLQYVPANLNRDACCMLLGASL
jgi:hypothetical protein